MDSIIEVVDLLTTNFEKFCRQGIQFGLVVASALFIWNSCIVLSGCDSPIVVVLSGSMEPAFYRGDLLFLTHHSWVLPYKNYDAGDIVVFDIKKPIPIVHRVIRYYGTGIEREEDYRILTKGDNNPIHDRGLYPTGTVFLENNDIGGRIKGIFPYVGRITIWMNEIPVLKWGMISILLILVLTSKEDN